MKFNFFSERGVEPSLRLRFVARAMQRLAVLGGVGLMAWPLMLLTSPQLASHMAGMWPRVVLSIAMSAVGSVSQFFAGRALYRRERWGAVVAAVISAYMLLPRGRLPTLNSLYIVEGVVGLVLVASIWKEVNAMPTEAELNYVPGSEDQFRPELREGFGTHTRRKAEANKLGATPVAGDEGASELAERSATKPIRH